MDLHGHAHAVIAHVVDAVNVGRGVGGAGLGREERLHGGVDGRGRGADALGGEHADGLEALGDARDLGEGVLAELGDDALAVRDHALGVSGHDLGVKLHVGADDVADLAQDLEGRPAGGGQDRGVGGHAVDRVVLHQALDGVDVGVVDDELHGCFLSLCRMRQRDRPFVSYRVCSVRAMMSSWVARESTLKKAE